MNFKEKLTRIFEKNNSLLCVGLDIDQEKLPDFLFKTCKTPFFNFNKQIIDATKEFVYAYKLNMAFYEVLGKKGLEILEKTIQYIPKEIIIILDGKRNDIGNTARKYAQAFFEIYNVDAVTLNPYLGVDSINPFLEYKNKCSFILCRTSNPSAVDFQNLQVQNKTLYEQVATKIKEWNKHGCCGAVAGATYPDELKTVRGIIGEDIPILIPGIGKQGGDIEKTVRNGTNTGGKMALVNSSRGIIYAENSEEFAKKARVQARNLRDEINKYR
jgi:orotidine-5'-phosphate decarboxylase